MPLVEKRYAEALIKLSNDSKWLDYSLEALKNLTKLYKNSDELKKFLLNPEFKKSDKKEVLKAITKKTNYESINNFISLLIDKGRINLLPEILTEYILLTNKYKSILFIKIVSAAVLDKNQIQQIENKFKKLFAAKSVKSAVEIDQNLIGGVKIIIGDKIYDNSIQANLLNLRNRLSAR